MNLRQLKYYVCVFEMRNMTHAAEILHIAQPALSQQMTLLEESLGVNLLIRKSKGVMPTREGYLLYRHAQTILRQVDHTRNILSKSDSDISGVVSIGMASSSSKILALPLIKVVKKRFPAVVLEILEAPSIDLAKLVRQGRVDFALAPDQVPIDNVTLVPLFTEDLLLLVNNNLGIFGNKVTIKTVSKLPLILPSLPNQLRMRVELAFQASKLSYNLLAETGDSTILIRAVKESIASVILPYSAAHSEIINNEITSYPIDFLTPRKIFLCYNNTIPPSPPVESVMLACKTLIRNLVTSNKWLACRV